MNCAWCGEPLESTREARIVRKYSLAMSFGEDQAERPTLVLTHGQPRPEGCVQPEGSWDDTGPEVKLSDFQP